MSRHEQTGVDTSRQVGATAYVAEVNEWPDPETAKLAFKRYEDLHRVVLSETETREVTYDAARSRHIHAITREVVEVLS